VDLMFSHVNQAEKSVVLPDHNFVFTDQFLNLLAGFRTRSDQGGPPAHGG